VTDKANLGSGLFAEWVKDPDFVLNHPETVGAEALLCGDNFGCGSSREHAPWALLARGFRVLISTGFADIFRNNSLGNGLLTVEVSEAVHAQLVAFRAVDSDAQISVDVTTRSLSFGDVTVAFELDDFAQHRLLHGLDSIDYLLQFRERISAFGAAR
jgi:3-isopropylmalate/(R)-2-methylmalate dehydratase small subunit